MSIKLETKGLNIRGLYRHGVKVGQLRGRDLFVYSEKVHWERLLNPGGWFWGISIDCTDGEIHHQVLSTVWKTKNDSVKSVNAMLGKIQDENYIGYIPEIKKALIYQYGSTVELII